MQAPQAPQTPQALRKDAAARPDAEEVGGPAAHGEGAKASWF